MQINKSGHEYRPLKVSAEEWGKFSAILKLEMTDFDLRITFSNTRYWIWGKQPRN